MFDLKITGGTIVDGSGAERFVGDVAITDGKIVAVSRGPLEGDATETIDATGRIVTPGFVDVHSHYDGQAFFDESLSPSNGHGVTTVVMGVCGIGFAPARPDAHEMLIETMESVEDIPGDVLRAGIPWEWETFPEFLDALDRRTYAMDIAAHIGHVPVRTYVMGEKALENGPATEGEIAADGRDREGGHRGRRRRLLQLPRRRPHHWQGRPGPRHLRHRGRAVRHRRRAIGLHRPPSRLRAGRGRRRRPGRRGGHQGGRLDAAGVGRVRPARVVPDPPGQLRPRPVARPPRRLRGGRGRRRRAAPPGRQPPLRDAARASAPAIRS